MDFSDPKKITEAAFLIEPAFQELVKAGRLDSETLGRISERIERIRKGFAKELEFVTVINWLGYCPAAHRIQELNLHRYDSSSARFRVPDVLAISHTGTKPIPFLIEVKNKEKNTLIWTEDYLSGLRRYADTVGLPLLVAWKRNRLWLLVDVRHFEKRVTAWHLPLEKAFKENLMSLLFGDVLVSMTQRISLFIDAKVLSESPLPKSRLLPVGNYHMQITDAGFLVDGQREKLTPELRTLFFCATDESRVEKTSDRTIRITHIPTSDSLFSLTTVALNVLLWRAGEGKEPDWNRIAKERIQPAASELRTALTRGIEEGSVEYVFNLRPKTDPDF